MTKAGDRKNAADLLVYGTFALRRAHDLLRPVRAPRPPPGQPEVSRPPGEGRRTGVTPVAAGPHRA
jgi:hypothetical protein